jgi:hypothetical protein
MQYLTKAGLEFLLESRKHRKAARKVSQRFHSRLRKRDTTPFLAQVHKALSTGVGPIDKETGKIQDLSQWKGHAMEPGKKSTGTIDVIGNPAHRAFALQSGRESQHCVGTACQELTDKFAKDKLKDKTKTQAKRDERELFGAAPDVAAIKTSLEINSPDTPKGAKGTRVRIERGVSEDLESSRPAFRKFLLNLGHKRRTEKANRPKPRRKIPYGLKGKALADALRDQDIEGLGF